MPREKNNMKAETILSSWVQNDKSEKAVVIWETST